jgi:hypothetical protein
MTAQAMSAGLYVAQATAREAVRPEHKSPGQAGGWDPEGFAREQIRGLVRQVFLANVEQPVRQVVFSPVEPETDVQNLCWRVGEALAMETAGSIGVVGEYPQALMDAETLAAETTDHSVENGGSGRRQSATRVGSNLWLVTPAGSDGEHGTTAMLHSYLGGMRAKFEYSIMVGPPAGESNTATAMAQFADGIILVLSAHRTRRATARKVKDAMEGARVRILGTVLSDRVFPIPERIYRRL